MSTDATDDLRPELSDLAAMVRELVAWEEGLGGAGFPVGAVAPPTASPAPAERAGPAEPAIVAPGAPASSSTTATSVVEELARLEREVHACTRCALATTRTHTVFARGNPSAEIVFVGEGPGYHEDQAGVPFVGPAGQLLDKMVEAMGYGRDEVYVCNVVKCRPPENRTPLPDEAGACAPFLDAQLELVRPRVIVALGRCAAENLGVIAADARGWRGVWGERRGVPVMPTYHPAFLLRSPQFKRPVWEDLKKVMTLLGRSTS